MKMTRDIYKQLRSEAARACWESRRLKDTELGEWYDGRYTAYKQSAALLDIAIRHDEWRASLGQA